VGSGEWGRQNGLGPSERLGAVRTAWGRQNGLGPSERLGAVRTAWRVASVRGCVHFAAIICFNEVKHDNFIGDRSPCQTFSTD